MTEKAGRLRVIADGKLPQAAITGTPAVRTRARPACWRSPCIPTTPRTAGSTSPTPTQRRMPTASPSASPPSSAAASRTAPGWTRNPSGAHRGTLPARRPALRLPHRLRRRRLPLLPHRRARPPATTRRTSPCPTARSTASTTTAASPRTTPSCNTPRRLPSVWTYGNRNPQGLDFDSRHRPPLGDRARPARRRRAQPHQARAQLRLARHHLRHELRRLARSPADGPRRHGAAAHLLGALDRGLRHGFLRGHRFPKWKNHLFVTSLAEEELRRLGSTATGSSPRRSSSAASGGCATWRPRPTAISTWP